ncbi:MAG: VWA domain-containing protein [Phycisphaerales bacterium]|nr:VWA domain-containing protein [Phycisphaerales bacterium]
MNRHFDDPEFLWLLPLALAPALLAAWRARRGGARMSSLAMFTGVRPSWRVFGRVLGPALRVAALACAIVALARPQELLGQTRISTEGIAVMVVIDRSASMTAPMSYKGERTDRFEVVKHVFRDFVLGDGKSLKGRPGDMVGLVAFAGFADTICPLVQQHETLVRLSDAVNPAPPSEPEGGTAIGDALALAVARLESAEDLINAINARSDEPPSFTIKSKVIVLLTDGENNRGQIDPRDSARLAAERGIKVYSIGIGGTGGFVSIPGATPGTFAQIPDTIDEDLLTYISETSGGQYWNARTAEAIRDCYARLDELETTTIDRVEFEEREERYLAWTLRAIGLLIGEIVLSRLVFRRAA